MLRASHAAHAADRRLAELVDEFSTIVNNREFPCVFASVPFATDELYVSRVRRRDDVPEQVLTELRALCETIAVYPDAVGVVFVDDRRNRTLDEDFELAADIVQHVMRHAGQGDGERAPRPDHPMWSLLVDGVALFVNVSSPNHRSRRSRNVGSTFTVIAQARESFDRLNRASPRVRREIRQRLVTYDDVAPHPALGWYGDPDNREAWQYFLGDSGKVYDPTRACPYHREPAIETGTVAGVASRERA